jgi:hypothetical protein
MAKKKKWKKRLGKALMAGAALAGGLALAKNRNRNAMIKGADANEGFGAMTLKDYGPHTIGGYHTPRRSSVLASPKWQEHDFGLGPYDGAKKGGRAGKDFGKRGVGKAKRGFGRALKKGK